MSYDSDGEDVAAGSKSRPAPSSSLTSAGSNASPRSHYGGLAAADAHAVVHQFIKDMQPRAYKSKQKKHITAFAKWYFHHKPVLSDADLSYLLLGDGDSKKGLLESCGNTNLKSIRDIKHSSVMALELVAMMLDSTLNVHAAQFMDFLPRVPLKTIQAMKLERHILSEQHAPDNAAKLLFMLQEQQPSIRLSEFLDHNHAAEERYKDWFDEHMDERAEEGEDGDKSSGPRTWAEVKLEDVDREEGVGRAMDAELEAVLAGTGSGEDAENESMDPLGLTKLTWNEQGQLVSIGGRRAGEGVGKGAASTSRRMKLFLQKLMKQKQKEAAMKGQNKAAFGGVSVTMDEEDEEGEGEGESMALLDTILSEKGSVNPSHADFNPVLFLTTVHSQTSLDKLQSGLRTLEAAVSNRAVALKQLVTQHFGQYVYAKDTIDHLHELLQGELSTDKGGSKSNSGRTRRLLAEIESLRTDISSLYAPLLRRKAQSDQIRSLQSLLSRFNFLLELPGKMMEYRRKAQWEQIIREYQKAKQFVVLPTNASSSANKGKHSSNIASPSSKTPNTPSLSSVPTASNSVTLLSLMHPSVAAQTAAAAANGSLGVPETILWQIGRLIADIRQELFSLLDAPNATGERQQKIISYLLQLDCDEDPAWYYLNKQKESIIQQFERAMEENCVRLVQHLQGTPLLKSFIMDPSCPYPSDSPMRLLYGSVPFHVLCLSTSECVSSLNKFIRRMCAILNRSLPNFYKLATEIESGKFGRFVPTTNIRPARTPRNATATPMTSISKAEEKQDQAHRGSIQSDEKSSSLISSPTTPIMSPTSTSFPSPIQSPSASETHNVGQLVSAINNQFSTYIRLALFPPAASTQQRYLVANGATTSASLSSPDINDPATDHPGVDLFPPSMFSHVHDILSCIERIRSLQMPQDHTLDLRLLADQLTQFYLEHHVRDMITQVAQLYKEEAWEVDEAVGGMHEKDGLSWEDGDDLFGGAGDSFFSFDSSSMLGSPPVSHGHAGTSASSSPFQVTYLSSQFSSIIVSKLSSFSALPVIQSKWVVERMVAGVFEAMKCFADGMHQLMMQITAQQAAQGYASDNMGGGSRDARGSGSMSMLSPPSTSIVSTWVRPNELDRRLLLIWSNVLHVSDSILLPLFDRLIDLLPVSTHEVLEQRFNASVMHLYTELLEGQLILAAYTRSKINHIQHIVKKGYFKSGSNWNTRNVTAPASTGAGHANANGMNGVASTRSSSSSSSSSSPARSPLLIRSCVLDLLLQFVLIHDEVYSVRADEVDAVMEKIVEALASSLLFHISHIEPECDVIGASQILLEVEFIESTLDYYMTDDSIQSFDICKQRLEESMESAAEVEADEDGVSAGTILQRASDARASLLQQLKASTSLMYACFGPVKKRAR